MFRWNIHHLIDLQPGEELSMFPIKSVNTDSSEPAEPEPTHVLPEELEEFTTGQGKPLVPKVVTQEEALMMDVAKECPIQE